MFNDSNTEENGEPMWWDGTQLRYEPIPEEPQEIKTERKIREQEEQERQRQELMGKKRQVPTD